MNKTLHYMKDTFSLFTTELCALCEEGEERIKVYVTYAYCDYYFLSFYNYKLKIMWSIRRATTNPPFNTWL